MTKRMLIDATHPEETRVVVLDGSRLEDFDVETATKKQLKGNIYLAKIVRVEPSLQAAFVEYGGSRHGFLAFGEIHPDYYQIPVADRQRLLAQQAEEAREAEAAEDAAAHAEAARGHGGDHASEPSEAAARDGIVEAGGADATPGTAGQDEEVPAEPALGGWPVEASADDDPPARPEAMRQDRVSGGADWAPEQPDDDQRTPIAALAELGLSVDEDGRIDGDAQAMAQLEEAMHADAGRDDGADQDGAAGDGMGPHEDRDGSAQPGPAAEAEDAREGGEQPTAPATVGGEAEPAEERERRVPSPRYLRNYKIQEVIRRRQIMLVQVVKEERGGKGAALTTYISLAGRFCVLMPNSPRGGGISRKITSAADRRRLKEVTTELDLPAGMGLIVRTAGAARPKPEIKRDCEYLLQLWDDIRDTTMKSVAPAAIYEEASLIKRAIRDVYSRDVDEVQVDGEAAWRAARDQMRLLMPSHAHKVQLWHDPSGQKLFAHHQVDAQLDAMLSPTVQLRSGGYLVINQTEALVAIDVNSGRSTRERGIEETALRTNLEAAEEVARQLRLRDLAGLIVIDFIDMEIRRNNAAVERKLTDALKNDRARIQLGSISHFGLMEMSRQRLRPSLAETSFVQCPHCEGTGHVRSTDGAAIHVLRAIEEEGGKRRSAEIMVHVAGPIAMYILNHKRERLREIETRYGMSVLFTPDPALLPPAVKIERVRAHAPGEAPSVNAPLPALPAPMPEVAESPDVEEMGEASGDRQSTEAAQPGEAGEAGRRRRRRRRRGGRREDGAAGLDGSDGAAPQSGSELSGGEPGADRGEPEAVDLGGSLARGADAGAPAEAPEGEPGPGGGRRRGRRGGRRRRREEPGAIVEADAEPSMPAYSGPTPADPFGGAAAFDIFDALERAEAEAERPFVAAPVQHSPEVSVSLAEPSMDPVPPAEIVEPAPVPTTEARRTPKPRRGSKAALAAAAAAEAQEAEAARLAATAEAAVSAPEPVPDPEPLQDAAPEPVIRPVLVDAIPAEAPRKGWWRR